MGKYFENRALNGMMSGILRCESCLGGRAIEILASEGGDPTAIEFPLPRSHYRYFLTVIINTNGIKNWYSSKLLEIATSALVV